jgi:hypothetical protein
MGNASDLQPIIAHHKKSLAHNGKAFVEGQRAER